MLPQNFSTHVNVRLAESQGHHGACHRGAVFRTRRSRPRRASPPPPGSSGWSDVSMTDGRWQRSANGGARPRTSLHAGKLRGGVGSPEARVSGSEHRSTEASSAVTPRTPLARSFGFHRRPLRGSLSAIAFPKSQRNVRVVSRKMGPSRRSMALLGSARSTALAEKMIAAAFAVQYDHRRSDGRRSPIGGQTADELSDGPKRRLRPAVWLGRPVAARSSVCERASPP